MSKMVLARVKLLNSVPVTGNCFRQQGVKEIGFKYLLTRC